MLCVIAFNQVFCSSKLLIKLIILQLITLAVQKLITRCYQKRVQYQNLDQTYHPQTIFQTKRPHFCLFFLIIQLILLRSDRHLTLPYLCLVFRLAVLRSYIGPFLLDSQFCEIKFIQLLRYPNKILLMVKINKFNLSIIAYFYLFIMPIRISLTKFKIIADILIGYFILLSFLLSFYDRNDRKIRKLIN